MSDTQEVILCRHCGASNIGASCLCYCCLNYSSKTMPKGVAKWILQQQLADENFDGMLLLLQDRVIV